MKTKEKTFKHFRMRAAMTLLLAVITFTTAWAAQPQKVLDLCVGGLNYIHISGWTYDPDMSKKSIDVHVYIYTDAACTDQCWFQALTANVPRPDVNEAKGITGSHGFDAYIPITVYDGDDNSYYVKVFAIDANGNGNPQIGTTQEVYVTNATSYNSDYTLYSGFKTTAGTDGGSTNCPYPKLVDGIIPDYSNNYEWEGAFWANNKAEVYVEFYSDVPIIPKGHILNIYREGRYPDSWTLKAKANAGDAWTTIAFHDWTINGPTGTEFDFPCQTSINDPVNSNAYQYFRFEAMRDNNGIQLSEYRLYGITQWTYTHLTVKAATCTEPGIKQECYQRNDGRYFTDETGETELNASDVIAPAAHNGVHHTTSTGEFWQCSMCGKLFSNAALTNEFTTLTEPVILSGGESYIALDGNTVTGSTSGRLTIADGASVTLKDVTINSGIICSGSATIILVGTNSVTGSSWRAGIQVGGTGTTLTIRGDGSLTATGNSESAGIGMSRQANATGGDIVIESGTITAQGGAGGAGIGTCLIDDKIPSTHPLGNIIIKSGTVTATRGYGQGGWSGKGIGTGYCYHDVTIGALMIYDLITMVDASNFSKAVTYMHGETDVSNRRSDYFTVTESNNRYIIKSKGIGDDPIIIADNTPFSQPIDLNVPSATYTKTLGADRVGKYQAWMVPFDYTLTAEDMNLFKFYKIHMIANAPSPSVEPTDEMWVFLTKLSADAVLHANMPYVYVPLTNVENYEFTTTPALVKCRNTGVIAKTETLEDIYSFYGTYENTTATAADPFYYVNINGSLSWGNEVTVGPNRWIIRKTSKYGETPAYAREMHFFDGEEDMTTDIIENTEKTEDTEGWYDLNGRHLSGKPSAAGIYIHNGKKEVVR